MQTLRTYTNCRFKYYKETEEMEMHRGHILAVKGCVRNRPNVVLLFGAENYGPMIYLSKAVINGRTVDPEKIRTEEDLKQIG